MSNTRIKIKLSSSAKASSSSSSSSNKKKRVGEKNGDLRRQPATTAATLSLSTSTSRKVWNGRRPTNGNGNSDKTKGSSTRSSSAQEQQETSSASSPSSSRSPSRRRAATAKTYRDNYYADMDDYNMMEDEDADADATDYHDSSSTSAAPLINDDLVWVPRQKPKNKTKTKRNSHNNNNSSRSSSTAKNKMNNVKRSSTSTTTTTTTRGAIRTAAGGNPSSSTSMVRSKRNNVKKINYSDDKKDLEQQEEYDDFRMEVYDDDSGAKEERGRRRGKQRGGGGSKRVIINGNGTVRRRISAATATAASTATNTKTTRRLSSSSDAAAAASSAAVVVDASGKRERKRKKRLYEEDSSSVDDDDGRGHDDDDDDGHDDDTADASYSVDDNTVTRKKNKKKKVPRKQKQILPQPSSSSTSITPPPRRSSASSVSVFKKKTSPHAELKNQVTGSPTTRTMSNQMNNGLGKTSYKSRPNFDDDDDVDDVDDNNDRIKEWGGLVLPTDEELMVEIAKLVPTPGTTTYKRKREEVLVVLDRFCDWVWTGRPTNDRQQFLRRFQELAGIQRVIFLLKQNTSWMECVTKVTQFLAWCFVSDVVQPTTSSPPPTMTTEKSGGSTNCSGSSSSVSKDLANVFTMKNGIHILLLAVEDVKRYNYDSRVSARASSNIWVCMTNVLQSSTNVKDYMRKGVIDVALDILDDLGSRSVSSTPEIPVIMQSIISTLGRIMSALSSKNALECEHQRDVLATVSVTFKSLQTEWITKKDTVLSFVDFLSRPEVVRVTRTKTLELYAPLVIAIVERYSIEPGIFQRSFSLIEIAFAVLDKETLAMLNVAELLKRLQFVEHDPMKSKVDELLKQLS